MAKIHLIGAALVAASIVAGCCDKKCEEGKDADKAPAANAAKPAPAPAAKPAEPKDPNEVVVSVNGEKLTRGKIDADVAAFVAKRGGQIPAAQLEQAKKGLSMQLAQQFIIEKILGEKAEKGGYKATEADVKARFEEIKKQFAGQPDAPKTLEEYYASMPLGKERARAEFERGVAIDKMIKAEVSAKNTKDYTKQAKEALDHVLKQRAQQIAEAKSVKEVTAEQALAKIKEIKAKLDKDPKQFEALAREFSACPSGKAKGGDLGEFGHGQMVKEFDEAAFKLPVDKISEPVKTQFGYHLIKVTKKIPAVAAKDGKPGTEEKVQASHILIKIVSADEVKRAQEVLKQPEPKLEDAIKFFKSQDERKLVNDYVLKLVRTAKIEAKGEFQQLLPPPEMPAPAPASTAKPKTPTAKNVTPGKANVIKAIESKPVAVPAPAAKPAAKPAPAPVAKPAPAPAVKPAPAPAAKPAPAPVAKSAK